MAKKQGAKTAKTASKNNPNMRQGAKKYLFDGKEISPVKLILTSGTILGAEYLGTGEIVVDAAGHPLPWRNARSTEL